MAQGPFPSGTLPTPAPHRGVGKARLPSTERTGLMSGVWWCVGVHLEWEGIPLIRELGPSLLCKGQTFK